MSTEYRARAGERFTADGTIQTLLLVAFDPKCVRDN